MPRFYCPIPLHEQASLLLPDAVAQHASRALRLRAGTSIVLFNGEGGEYHAQLAFDGGKAVAENLRFIDICRELPFELVLCQALASGDKMEWIVEKAVEMGVSALLPISAERSVLQLQGDRAQKRLNKWQAIVQSSSEQCGRNTLMQVQAPQSVKMAAQALSERSDALILLCHPEASQSLMAAVQAYQEGCAGDSSLAVVLCVGPEGGWSPDELAHWQKAGAQCIQAGPRVLRTETAGIAFASALQTLLGY